MATNINGQDLSITLSEEYKQYIEILSDLSSHWVPSIRLQFAKKAYNCYQDPSIRKLVFAYGEDAVKRRRERYRQFEFAAEWHDCDESYLEDSNCLIHDSEYRRALFLLFEIE